jgi:2',3'-cyclic-nucleotide 2'-phosphodiesterase (5'-nucleotidase family)
MIELLNHLGIEYVVLGNHEFDFGARVLRERMKASKFTYFGSNVLERSSGKIMEGIVDTELVELSDGLKLGLFGVCTQETPQLSYPGEDVMFDDVFKTSKRCVDTLLADGADFIIALTHLTIEQDRQLARRVKGINVMLGGHDHEPFTLYEGNTFIHKSGQNAFWLGKLEFLLSKSAKHPERPLAVSTQWSMIANQHIPPQPACQKIVYKYTKMLEDEDNSGDNNRVLALLGLPLSTKTAALRAGECNMGNLVSDALRSELNADFGLINGGFIRGNRIYEARTTLTVGVLNQEMPFPRPAVLIRIQAKYVRKALNQHLSKYPQMSGSHPHVSGLRLTVDIKTQPPVITSMKNEAGEEVDPEAEVLMATTKFIANGGDGCTAWLEGEVIRTADKITVHVADYLMKKRLIAYPELEGRITLVD